MVTPVSVTSTANLDSSANNGPLWGTFNANPVYNKKPFFDLSNPLILAAVVGVAWLLWKRRR